MNESQYSYVITFNTELDGTKQIRIADANTDLTQEDITTSVNSIAEASIFDRVKVGTLTKVSSVVLEEVKHIIHTY